MWWVALAAGGGERPLVAVVLDSHAQAKDPKGEGRAARRLFDVVAAALDEAGILYAKLDDTRVEAGGLRGYRVAVFPYATEWPEKEIGAVEAFVERGGKVMLFYTIPKRLHKLIGTLPVGWLGRQEPRKKFATVRFLQPLVPGLPEAIRQDSWNIVRFLPGERDVQVVGRWHGPDGASLSEGAVAASPRGAYMGHVLTPGDVKRKAQMLQALLGHLEPRLWRRAARDAIASARKLGALSSLEALALRIRSSPLPGARRDAAEGRLAEARRLLAESERLVRDGQYAPAIPTAKRARRMAEVAYLLSAVERADEFRAVWIHAAKGVKDWGWARSARHLRDMGFNAVIPNMLWAGLAYYPSKVVPVAPGGVDQIAECLAACEQYGIECHVWKVNYNLSTAPGAFVDRLRAEGRLGRHRDGSELRWLCPSDPRNLALERDSMLEVVRRYAVHGIHFDYIRYPHQHACFCDGCRERFQRDADVKVAAWPADVSREPLKARFGDWRREQVTRLVREVATEARRIRPGVLVSAAVFSNWEAHRDTVGQDWKLWVEEGLLDFVCPMDYTTNPDSLSRLVKRQVGWVDGRVPLYPGIGAWRLDSAAALLDQIERARRLGADGFVCFHYNDLVFANERMPALHGSLTVGAARPPHPAPRVSFGFPAGLEGFDDPAYWEASALTVRTILGREGNFPRPVVRADGELSLETTDGSLVTAFERLSSEGGPVDLRIAGLAPGRYRLAVRGRAVLGFGEGRDFVVRSRPFEMVSTERVQAERAKRLPPVFETKGVRVGVVAGGYGSGALLTVFGRAAGIEARALHQVTPAFLGACEVVVFPQPRKAGSTTKDMVNALRAFVRAGGGLLATHDAAGFRTHPPLIPEVARGAARVDGTTWRATGKHPLVWGMQPGQATAHSYDDFIALAPGPDGEAVADGIAKDGKTAPVLVCGNYGEGRYAACGLALGLDPDDRDAEPTGAEFQLLLNATNWLR
jgi:uncharacterized lipoprotein YddW (UPF0748 family)